MADQKVVLLDQSFFLQYNYMYYLTEIFCFRRHVTTLNSFSYNEKSNNNKKPLKQ